LEKLARGDFFTSPSFGNKFEFVHFPQHDPLAHKRLLCNLVIGCAREYSRTTCALAPLPPTSTSSNTTSVFTALHPKLDGYFLLFLKDYELNQNLELSYDYFKMAFQRMPHQSISGPSRMVFEHLQDCFHLEDSTSGFFQLFQLCSHITKDHIPP
jgi:hypothetical protein